MTITPLPPTTLPAALTAPSRVLSAAPDEPDAVLGAPAVPHTDHAFGRALLDARDSASAALSRADGAERAFAAGRGGLQEMVLERARADIALSLASSAAGRVTQALGTILGMQV